MKKFFRKPLILWGGFLLGIVVDQWTKMVGGPIAINSGISFGVSLLGWETALTFLSIVGLLILWRLLGRSFWLDWSFIGLLAGAGSNLLDRLIWGGVRDWLTFPGMSFQNNFADVLIVVGTFGIIRHLIYEK